MKNILLLTVAIIIGSSGAANAEALNFDYTPQIEFNSAKPNWYQSNFKNLSDLNIPSFEISLQTDDDIQGEWSMQFIDTDNSKIKSQDISSKILYLSMRYKFK